MKEKGQDEVKSLLVSVHFHCGQLIAWKLSDQKLYKDFDNDYKSII